MLLLHPDVQIPAFSQVLKKGGVRMELLDVLKAKAGVPVRDPIAFLLAARKGKTEHVIVYRTTDERVYRCSDENVYALKEE